MKYYAGIGSRKTPDDMLGLMYCIAQDLEDAGYTLRSGGAEGADASFEKGVTYNKEIFRPRHANDEAISLASNFHPAWGNCNDHVRKLHGRNAQIVMGKNLDKPVEFLICWSPNENYGGTSMGIKIARANNIPVYNLNIREDRQKLK